MDKKYQVFLSSTYIDLKDARQKVLETILELQQFPAGMEVFPAGDDDQWTHIKSVIDKSDYYVLILGHRYGSLAPDKLSYTEKEYDYAREKNIPVLAFIRERDVPTQDFEREGSQTSQRRLLKFIEKAKANKLCRFWRTPEDLVTKVSTSLATAFSTHPQLGWVRADQAASPKVMEEVVELNRENRQLKVELEKFRKLNTKVPYIEVNINEENLIKLHYQKYEDHSSYMPLPKKIDPSSIPGYLLSYINKEEVEDFNNTVWEDSEKVVKYNSDLIFYKRLKETGLEFNLSISNIGEKKANNIYADIEFPPEIIVIEGKKVDIKEPDKPTLHKNPVDKAEKDHKRRMSPMGVLVNGSSNVSTVYGDVSGSMINYKDLNFRSDLKGNMITIYSKELLHTRTKTSNEGFILVPTKVGQYEVKVSIICEEYSSRDEYTIPLIVNEN
ncbi:DUF4062 domain-containing protein [Peribacillus frigoritolerans]|uniref:DUF4062 domain-containing protein n=1 Tax=Peribacillus frigoritolerans TaxID=450367 RepID=UPI003F812B9F